MKLARSSFTPAAQKNVEALRSTGIATEQARQAEDLMQQVRALGRLPKETYDPKECRLAHGLRKARATGPMTAHEPELTSIAAEDERRRVIAAKSLSLLSTMRWTPSSRRMCRKTLAGRWPRASTISDMIRCYRARMREP